MSQVAINVDTESKIVSVNIDGTPVDDVRCIRIDKYKKEEGSYGPEFEVCISTAEKNGDIKKFTTYTTMGSDKNSECKYNGFIEVDSLGSAIARYMKRQ